MSGLKQLIFGVKNCNCNKRRKDGLHNVNCVSLKNGWSWKVSKLYATPNRDIEGK